MGIEESVEPREPPAADKPLSVFILGSTGLRTELLTYALTREIGANCLVIGESAWFSGGEHGPTQGSVLLVDAALKDPRSFVIELEAYGPESDSGYHIAIVNLPYSLGIEKRALSAGVVGFFYNDQGLDLLVRGIESVARGDVWMPREILLECALGSTGEHVARDSNLDSVQLTPRERQVLLLIYMGRLNEEIADQLGIAENTVKTHLYRLYRKIGVPNRVQAAMWAAQNLPIS